MNKREDARAVVERIDLATLATELVGPPRGTGRSRKWPSPVRDHPQTGATPPMSIFVGRDGKERWHCFGTGRGGDAIDLLCEVLNTDWNGGYEAALAYVGDRRAGLAAVDRSNVRAPRASDEGCVERAELESLAANAHSNLVAGHPWLQSHGLTVAQARHYEIGRISGTRVPGMKYPIRDALTIPVKGQRGELVGVDLRLMDGGTKYLPLRTRDWDGLNFVRPRVLRRVEVIAVCEGSIDAIVMAEHTGIATVAVLSSTHANAVVGERLRDLAAGRRVILALDDDAAGNRGADRLAAHVPNTVRLSLGGGDVGEFVARGGRLDRRVRVVAPPQSAIEEDFGL